MRIIVTCGPSFEPIDGARRMTNMSTGKLGVALSNHLSMAGHHVICLKGDGSTYTGSLHAAEVDYFGTNDDLMNCLGAVRAHGPVDAIFHAAALCDYRVEQVMNDSGETLASRKFVTRSGRLHLIMAPATKVLPTLRDWFPGTRIVGWKYELAGTREDAFDKAWKQLRDCRTDACVLNGAAYGDGFAMCLAGGKIISCDDTPALCEQLTAWLPAVARSTRNPAVAI